MSQKIKKNCLQTFTDDFKFFEHKHKHIKIEPIEVETNLHDLREDINKKL